MIPVAAQAIGKSESFLSYYLRDRGGVVDRAIKLTSLSRVLSELGAKGGGGQAPHLVCFDDVICSGGSMIKALVDDNPNKGIVVEGLRKGTLKISIVVSIASHEGINNILKSPPLAGIAVVASRVIQARDEVFAPDSVVIPESARKRMFRDFCVRLGEQIYDRNNPLGWGSRFGWCIALDYTVPNMTVPIIFQEGSASCEWHPLFPRSRTIAPLTARRV